VERKGRGRAERGKTRGWEEREARAVKGAGQSDVVFAAEAADDDGRAPPTPRPLRRILVRAADAEIDDAGDLIQLTST